MSNNNNTPPPWSEAPPWAKYIAQDETGEWWWYEKEPVPRKDGWDDTTTQSMSQSYKCPNWRDTLQKRPENE